MPVAVAPPPKRTILDVRDYGTVGNGVADDTAAIQAAENARQAAGGSLFFAKGTYLVTSQIDVGDRCAWFGVRSERGSNYGGGTYANYYAVKIVWRPTDTSTYFVSEVRTDASNQAHGPYQFENIHFDLGDANGFELGKDVQNEVSRYTTGVRFVNCAFRGTLLSAGSADGTITRPGRRMLSLGNHFETVVEDVSFWGGDVHIYSSGGDMPSLSRIRSTYAMVPFECVRQPGTASSNVPGVMDTVQIEIWRIAAMVFNERSERLQGCRWENSQLTETGVGRFALTETFAVTSGSGTLTASASMTNKLFPNASLLELTDGTNTDTVLVTAVSGTTITIDTQGFGFDWTAAAATATRIHGHGILTRGLANVSIEGGSPASAPNTPCVVYVVGQGQVSMSQLHAHVGSHGDMRAQVVGNRYWGQPYMQAGLYVDSCSPLISPNPANPFVHVTNARANNGAWNYSVNYRMPLADLAEEESLTRRRWVFSPRSTANVLNNMHLRLMKMLPGEGNTQEQIAAWAVDAAANLDVLDRTLPTTGNIRITVRMRAKTTGGTVTVSGYKVGLATTLFTPTMTTAWQVFTWYGAVPASTWLTGRTNAIDAGLRLTPSQAAFVAAVQVDELVGPFDAAGAGTPEAVLTAPIGSTYKRTDGAAGTSFYIKESGTGNTGWVAK